MASKRIKTKNIIVTRHKSALLQRQLRPMDRSMTSITQLLKRSKNKQEPGKQEAQNASPKSGVTTRNQKLQSQSPVKSSPTNSKSDKKVFTMVEYYPNKVKRQILAKKVVLKPRNEMTVIARTSKRKWSTPHKGVGSETASPKHMKILECQQSPKLPDLDIVDVIRAVEESQDLDDEDLMEILTCPSPVWWEDPPDCTYVEEPIKKRIIKEEERMGSPSTEIKVTPVINDNKNIDTKLKDVNYDKKRSKLEKLLNNMKDKMLSEISQECSKDAEGEKSELLEEVNADSLHCNENTEQRTLANSVDEVTNDTIQESTKVDCNTQNNVVETDQGSSTANLDSNCIEKKVANFFGCDRRLKIKNPQEINREAEERHNKIIFMNKETFLNKRVVKVNINKDKEKNDLNEVNHDNETKTRELESNEILKEKELRSVGSSGTVDLREETDTILSDNTDISDGSVTEELLKNLENMTIPIGDRFFRESSKIEPTAATETVIKNSGCLESTEIREKVKKGNIKKKPFQINNKSLKNHLANNKDLTDNITVKISKKSGESINSQKNIIPQNIDIMEETQNSSKNDENQRKDDTYNNNVYVNETEHVLEEEVTYDSYELDLKFENAILGLENSVLKPGKRRMSTSKSKTNTGVNINKELKTKYLKVVAVTNKRTKQLPRKESIMTDPINTVESVSNVDESSDTAENISKRGRIRRRKTHFDDNYASEIKNMPTNKKLRRVSNPEISPEESDKVENVAPKFKRRKQVHVDLIDYEPEVLCMSSQLAEKSIVEPEIVESVSQRGRIRRKKVPFTAEKDNNKSKTLKETDYQKDKESKTSCTNNSLNDSAKVNKKNHLHVKRYSGKNWKQLKYTASLRKVTKYKVKETDETELMSKLIKGHLPKTLKQKMSRHKACKNKLNKLVKQYVNRNNGKNVPELDSNIKPDKSVKIDPTVATLSKDLSKLNIIDKKVSKCKKMKSVHDETENPDEAGIHTDAVLKQHDAKRKPKVKIDVRTYAPKKLKNNIYEDIESISDSGITFIDSPPVPNSQQSPATYSRHMNRKGINAEEKTILENILNRSFDNDTAENCSDNVQNLGPNYKNLAPSLTKGDDVCKRQNEEIVFNTNSQKSVAVQNITEFLENSEDLEMITVYKIIPKGIEETSAVLKQMKNNTADKKSPLKVCVKDSASNLECKTNNSILKCNLESLALDSHKFELQAPNI